MGIDSGRIVGGVARPALLTACALGALIATPALAQSGAPAPSGSTDPATAPAQTTAGSDIVVTGIRASIAESSQLKRDADQVVDIVSAEDIGKLPDANVAESLQRVPGVQIERNFGEGAQIAIRGLSQVRVELNGRSNLGISVGATGSDASGRSTGLEQLSSTLFSRLAVFKSPTADQIEGGLGGFVSMTTPDPFDYKKPTFGYNFELTDSNLATERRGYNAAVFATVRLLDDRLGLTVNLSASERDIGSSQFTRGVWQTGGAVGVRRDFDGNGINDFVPQVVRSEFFNVGRERYGASGTVKFAATDTLTLYADALYAKLTTERDTAYFSFQTTETGGNAPVYVSGTSVDNYIVAGTLRNQRLRVGGIERSEPTTSIVAGGGVEFDNGPVKIKADLGRSIGNYDFRQDLLEVGSRPLVISYDYRTGDVPNITLPADFDPNARSSYPTRTNFAAGQQFVRTNETAFRLDGTFETQGGVLRSIQTGLRVADLNSKLTDFQSRLGGGNVNIATLPDIYFGVAETGGFPGTQGNFPTEFLRTFPYAEGKDFEESTLLAFNYPLRDRLSRNYDINERTMAAYARANFEGDLGSLPFKGNIGVRYVATDFKVDSFTGTSTTAIPQRNKNNYDDWLPAANLAFLLRDDLTLRFAASKVIARARLQDLAPNLFVDQVLLTATGGNAALNPTRADQYDVSLEYYPSNGGLISLAAFQKDIQDQVARTVRVEVIPGFEQLGPIQRTLPINLGTAKIRGLEFNLQQTFDFLPGLLSGFGTQVNATLVDSDSSDGQPVIGLSKKSFNGVLFYERSGFQARVAYNWRSRAANSFTSSGDVLRANYIAPYEQVDASISYQIIKPVTVSLSVTNLFFKDAAKINYNVIRDAVNGYEINDRYIRLGLRGRF
ncbi:TonB-dependent receptor [Sphingomonas lenta]|nr:TonB-dependent receptor [Sphingomonas lenta]